MTPPTFKFSLNPPGSGKTTNHIRRYVPPVFIRLRQLPDGAPKWEKDYWRKRAGS